MNRPIKFRAWDVENQTWTFVTLGDLVCGACLSSGDKPLSGGPQIWEQSTGLKDKNGKEIYEGDIVEWVNGLGEKHIFEILWNECKASFQMVEIGQEYPYILQGLSDKMKPYCEVIGNIHQNKELLGCENE